MFGIILSKNQKGNTEGANGSITAVVVLQVTCQALAWGSALGPTDCLLAGFM